MTFSMIDIKIYSYMAVILLLHVLYIMIFVGMGNINKAFVEKLNTFVQISIGVFLFVKFFPLRQHKLEPGDGAIIFGCSTFILTNVGVNALVMRLIEKGVFNTTGIKLPFGGEAAA